MVKSYLRYECIGVLGLVCGAGSVPSCLPDRTGRIAISAAAQNVCLWDWKKGTLLATWQGEDHEVTALARSPVGTQCAVGYADGKIKLWNWTTHAYTAVFQGHRGAVTALAFDSHGARLFSGGKDNEIVAWDVIAEAGLFRLRGHKDMVTDLRVLVNGDQLVSSSKDTLLKVWDLQTQHCVETLVGHRSEVWTFDVNEEESLLVSGSADREIRAWNIRTELLGKQLEESGKEPEKAFSLFGLLPRQGTERITTLRFAPGGHLLCQSAEKIVEVFRVRNEEEIAKKLHRKKQRKREKSRKKGEEASEPAEDQEPEQQDGEEEAVTVELMIAPSSVIRPAAKVRSISAVASEGSQTGFKLFCALQNNSIEVYSVEKKAKADEVSHLSSVELPGHRSDIRTVAISSDDQIFATGSNNSIKIWNARSRTCIRTMASGYALCCMFTPGNRQVLVGTKTGEIEIFDIASSSLIRSVKAHSGAVWSMDITADGSQLVTGSADHDVKFWNFDLAPAEDEDAGPTPKLTVVHAKTLRMSDDVLCLKISRDQKYLAVSLLDSTVKVFYMDTLKFFLSLYGHKLPALCMDISSDGTLLITGSADKNVKIWGLDFGDCHKSIFAHNDSIMAAKFVPNTHYFFTASKDKTIKYWDGDKFEQIMKLEGHLGEIWGLAMSSEGDFIVSGSHDRSIRIWERTSEQLFVEEEREREMEKLIEEDLENERERPDAEKEEKDMAGKKSIETIKAGERLLEAIEVAKEERAKLEEHRAAAAKLTAEGKAAPPPPPAHPIMAALGNLSPAQYVLHVAREVRSSELDQALLLLPFSLVPPLLEFVDEWVRGGWQVELSGRILFSLLKTHQNRLSTSRQHAPLLTSLRSHFRALVAHQRDSLGFNLAALNVLKREWEYQNSAEFFDASKLELLSERKMQRGAKRRKLAHPKKGSK